MKNSADLGGCYPPRPSASVDNTLLYLQNFSYPTQPHAIIANYISLFITCLSNIHWSFFYGHIQENNNFPCIHDECDMTVIFLSFKFFSIANTAACATCVTPFVPQVSFA